MTQNSNSPIPMWLYVLLLEQGKIYAGITSKVDTRIDSHFTGRGSEWTKKFKPDIVYEKRFLGEITVEQAREYEYYETRSLMGLFGVNNVRGAGYTKTSEYRSISNIR